MADKVTNPPLVSGTVERLVRLVDSHSPGLGCKCFARHNGDCICNHIDWRSREEVAAITALNYCLKTLRSHHMTKPGIAALVRNTGIILGAKTRKPNPRLDRQEESRE